MPNMAMELGSGTTATESDVRARLWEAPPAMAVKFVPSGVSVTRSKSSFPQLMSEPSDFRARLW